jgi:hypothetical protein
MRQYAQAQCAFGDPIVGENTYLRMLLPGYPNGPFIHAINRSVSPYYGIYAGCSRRPMIEFTATNHSPPNPTAFLPESLAGALLFRFISVLGSFRGGSARRTDGAEALHNSGPIL